MAYPPKQFSVAELQTLFEEKKYPYVMDQEVIYYTGEITDEPPPPWFIFVYTGDIYGKNGQLLDLILTPIYPTYRCFSKQEDPETINIPSASGVVIDNVGNEYTIITEGSVLSLPIGSNITVTIANIVITIPGGPPPPPPVSYSGIKTGNTIVIFKGKPSPAITVDLNGAVITNLPKKVQIALPEIIYKKYAIYAYDENNQLIVNQKYDIDEYQVEDIGFIVFPFAGQ